MPKWQFFDILAQKIGSMENQQNITDVFSGRAPFVVEHQISVPPEKIIWGVVVLIGAGLIFSLLKKYLT